MRTVRGTTWLLVCAGALASGCYATKSVRPEELRALGGNLRDSASLPSPSGRAAILDGEALVRLNSADRGSTDWIPAGSLFVSQDALFVEAGVAPSQLVAATVGGLAPEQVERLRTMAPAGGSLVSEIGPSSVVCRLTVREPGTLLPWLTRFGNAQPARTRARGTWRSGRRPGGTVVASPGPSRFPSTTSRAR